jgi:cation diffusion facilitator family transporter
MTIMELEKRALLVSIGGALLMAVLGVYFAVIAESEAIMLDGVFSAIGFVMASITLKVAGLVNRPDDEHFNYGYSHFAPLMNVLKSLMLLVLCTAALLSAVQAVLNGGRSMAVGVAVIYGVVATVGCLGIAIYIRMAAKKTGSALVAVDAESWLIDTLLSGAVLAAFIVGALIEGGPIGDYLNYLDPLVVGVLCVVSLPIPIRILRDNLREVLLFAPDLTLRSEVESHFKRALPELAKSEYRMRLLKMGNTVNVLIHICPGPGFTLGGLKDLDQMRDKFNAALAEMDARAVADLVFIADMRLAD